MTELGIPTLAVSLSIVRKKELSIRVSPARWKEFVQVVEPPSRATRWCHSNHDWTTSPSYHRSLHHPGSPSETLDDTMPSGRQLLMVRLDIVHRPREDAEMGRCSAAGSSSRRSRDGHNSGVPQLPPSVPDYQTSLACLATRNYRTHTERPETILTPIVDPGG